MFKSDLFSDEKYCSECGSNNIDEEVKPKFCKDCGTEQDGLFTQ